MVWSCLEAVWIGEGLVGLNQSCKITLQSLFLHTTVVGESSAGLNHLQLLLHSTTDLHWCSSSKRFGRVELSQTHAKFPTHLTPLSNSGLIRFGSFVSSPYSPISFCGVGNLAWVWHSSKRFGKIELCQTHAKFLDKTFPVSNSGLISIELHRSCLLSLLSTFLVWCSGLKRFGMVEPSC